ncbi:MAG: peptide-methionine (S)-S-oxide reductase [Halothiobacillaceae bacterium]|nr:MAG: peptide-methionine (S)-S-oxide reductase [Halothiobacillaceae bacterium]
MTKSYLPGWWLAGVTMLFSATPAMAAQETAIFAGGCFWCTESDFDKITGVISTTSGYIGGALANPTYEQVSAGGSGHAEAVQVVFDPTKISYAKLLELYWRTIDPTVVDQQFCDHGSQYRSAIFYLDAKQQQLALTSKAALEKSKPFKEPIATEIVQATTFYPAEEYHQDFHHKNELKYTFYRYRCGRDQRLTELWGQH